MSRSAGSLPPSALLLGSFQADGCCGRFYRTGIFVCCSHHLDGFVLVEEVAWCHNIRLSSSLIVRGPHRFRGISEFMGVAWEGLWHSWSVND